MLSCLFPILICFIFKVGVLLCNLPPQKNPLGCKATVMFFWNSTPMFSTSFLIGHLAEAMWQWVKCTNPPELLTLHFVTLTPLCTYPLQMPLVTTSLDRWVVFLFSEEQQTIGWRCGEVIWHIRSVGCSVTSDSVLITANRLCSLPRYRPVQHFNEPLTAFSLCLFLYYF